MGKYLLLFFLNISFSYLHAQTNFTTPEILGEKTFDAIKNIDLETFIKFAINETDKKELLEKIKPEEKKEAGDVMSYYMYKWKYDGDKAINDLHRIGREKGVDWKKATFEKVEYEIIEREGMQKADIYILFKSENSPYKIKLDDCRPTSRGWILIDDVTFR